MSSSDQQEDDFLAAMQDVKPLKQGDRVLTSQQGDSLAKQLKRQAIERRDGSKTNYLSVESVSPVDPYDMLSFKQDGVQQGVFKNLRLGKYDIEFNLSLQNMKFEQARSAVFDTIIAQHSKGTRCLLLRHGIGLHSKPFPAMMKSYVAQWLTQMPEVLAYHSALKQHGGVGAMYVLLKKNREQKQQNRELHQRR